MDSNALEREPASPFCEEHRIMWGDFRINIVDTPGTGFGGEVERVCMVDCVLLAGGRR